MSDPAAFRRGAVAPQPGRDSAPAAFAQRTGLLAKLREATSPSDRQAKAAWQALIAFSLTIVVA